LQTFELTLDSLLDFVQGMIGVHNTSLEATIDQMHTAINGDPLLDTFEGQVAVLLGESAVVNALSQS
jgi:hypothetical protein